MIHHQPSSRTTRILCRHSGFTLMEILVALGIFLIGMVAVASIFPVAIVTQRQTVDDVLSQQVLRNAQSIIGAKPLLLVEVDATVPYISSNFADPRNLYVRALPNGSPATPWLVGFPSFGLTTTWTIGDRSYPLITQDELGRDYYWIPLIKRETITQPPPPPPIIPLTPAADWRLIVFVLLRDHNDYDLSDLAGSNANIPDGLVDNNGIIFNRVPHVVSVPVTDDDDEGHLFINNQQFPTTSGDDPDQIRLGDIVVDNNGIIFNVIDADATSIQVQGFISVKPEYLWYGRPAKAGAASPTRRVFILSDAVKP